MTLIETTPARRQFHAPLSPVRVLYIGGYSRSGSTILARLLGEMPGLVAVGELFDVWARSYGQNQLCGCGLPFRECEFWSAVTRAAFHCDGSEVPAAEYAALRRRVIRRAALPSLWLPATRSQGFRRHLRRYAGLFERLYAGIADAAGSRTIVDSSKEPHHAWVLREIASIELHVVHLVRDARAVAYSWKRRKARPEIHWKTEDMERRGSVRTAVDWNLVNLLVSTRRRGLASYSLIRYEDLVDDPATQLSRIADALGERWNAEAVLGGSAATLRPSHTASGNPSRFAVGATAIRRDDEWISSMTPRERLVVTALTAPTLARYRYPLAAW